jgi:beta-glucanase (GH16 family)
MAHKYVRTVSGFFAAFFILLVGCGGGSAGPTSSATPTQQSWTLVWSDEFNGTNGSPPDAAKWVFDLGGGGWGNNELETYTSRTENAYLQDGVLVMEARQEDFTGVDGIARHYTSARLKTLGHFAQTYGRFEARLKLPYGQGLWPAFWMMGTDVGEVGWPQCGEIDIMENIGREPSIVHATIHGPGYSDGGGLSSSYALPGGQRFADDFHVFAVEWEKSAIRFYVDDHLYATRTPGELPAGTTWIFDHPFFLIMNVAVGGSWPWNPDSSTVFPQTLLVDYVRVYKRGQ